jgi:HlyD family type I secretion membrane fusion protein
MNPANQVVDFPGATPRARVVAPPTLDIAAQLRRLRRSGVLAFVAWLALFIAWTLWAPISGSVVGSGQVKVEANRQTVSHRDGGTVAQVLVREGQLVKRGQPLVVLEDMRIDSSVDLLDTQLAAEGLRKSRLEAEAAQQAVWTPPPLAAGIAATPRVREALARERAAFEARKRTLHGQIDSARAQITDIETEMLAHERDAAAASEALRLLRDELAANEALLKDNFINRTRVLALQRGVADYESRVQASRAEHSKARQKRSELEGRIAAARDIYLQTASEELRDATARLVDIEERLRSGRDTAGRQVIKAPSDGRLVDLRVNTVGSALGPREPIVDIVPSSVPLVVEVRVSADAISDVHPGQRAEIKLLAYRQRDTGLLEGRVVNVSADALTESRTGAAYFAVQAEVSPEALAQAGDRVLLPGMAAEVYIRTSERSALQFLLEPLTSALRRSFREH